MKKTYEIRYIERCQLIEVGDERGKNEKMIFEGTKEQCKKEAEKHGWKIKTWKS